MEKKKYKIKIKEDLSYIRTEKMSSCKVLVGLPCFGGNLCAETVSGLIKVAQRSIQHKIQVDFYHLANESLIPRARNKIVAHFLASKQGYTHLMFIDVDSEFEGDDVFKLLHFNKDVIGGPVCVKKYPIRHVMNIKGAREGKIHHTSDKKIVEVSNIGSAFYMIKRRVFEEMKKAYPELSADPHEVKEQVEEAYSSGEEGSDYYDRYVDNFYTFYDTGTAGKLGLTIEDQEKKEGQYLSEDYTFAQRWKEICGKMWIDPRILVGHIGRHVYFGNPMNYFPKELWLPEDYELEKKLANPTKLV